MQIRITLEFFEKNKCLSITIFLQTSRCVSNELQCLKTTRLHDKLSLLSNLGFFPSKDNYYISLEIYYNVEIWKEYKTEYYDKYLFVCVLSHFSCVTFFVTLVIIKIWSF